MAAKFPRFAKLVSAWLVAYFSYGLFFPIVSATLGVAVSIGIELWTAVDVYPKAIAHMIDRQKEEDDGQLHRWYDEETLTTLWWKSDVFSRFAVAMEKTDPTFWAKANTGDKYVTATGTGTTCSFSSPCSYTTAVTGAASGGVLPGVTIWVRSNTGVYTMNDTNKRLVTTVNGTAANPIKIRRYLNEIPVFDWNFDLHAANSHSQAMGPLNNAGQYTWLWGIYATNTTTTSRMAQQPESSNDGPFYQNEIILSAQGSRMIHCWIRGADNGVLTNTTINGVYTGDKRIDYNWFYDNGYWGNARSYGHSIYAKNRSQGEANRIYFHGNVGLRAWQVGVQWYGTGDPVSYIQGDYNIEAASGHGNVPNTSWPARGNWSPYFLGSDGSGITSCHSSDKVLFKYIFDHNVAYGGGSGLNLGGAKGSCDGIFTNNLLYEDGAAIAMTTPQLGGASGGCQTTNPDGTKTPYVCGGTYGPLTLTGNTFIATPDGSGGCLQNDSTCAKVFTQANYQNNQYLSGYPTSGQERMYVADSTYELGWGQVYVMNWDLDPNVDIDLNAMGVLPNQSYQIWNWQDYSPQSSTPVTSGTCSGTCGVISVPATISASNITPTLFTTDGTPGNTFAKAPDLGPRMVVFFATTNFAASPTPTQTATNTRTSSPTQTFTRTASFTSTPSFTATKTFTNTPTGVQTATFTPTVTFTASVTPSQSPTNTQTFTKSNTPTNTATNTRTPSNTPSFTASATFTPSSTPTPIVASLVREAESCVLTAPMVVGQDSEASSGSYIKTTVSGVTTPLLGGKAACLFTIPATGDWYVWAKVKISEGEPPNTPNYTNTDSIWMVWDTETVNSPTTYGIFDVREEIDCTSGEASPHTDYGRWYWARQNNRGKACTSTTTGITYGPGAIGLQSKTTLTAGPHVLNIYGREVTSGVSAQVDRIIITADEGYDPNGNTSNIGVGNTRRHVYVNLTPTRIPTP